MTDRKKENLFFFQVLEGYNATVFAYGQTGYKIVVRLLW